MSTVISVREGPLAVFGQTDGKTYVMVGENTLEAKRQALLAKQYADGAAGGVEEGVALATAWAAGTEPGGAGTKSAREYAATAQTLVGAAQTALQPGSPISSLSETPLAKVLTAGEREQLSELKNIAGTLPIAGDALWEWHDKYRRIAAKITRGGVMVALSFRTSNAMLGDLTITGKRVFGSVTEYLAPKSGSLQSVDVDRYRRKIAWRKDDGTTGFFKLERPGGAKVYDQIDALIAADAARGPAPSASIATLRSALKRGFFPDIKRTDVPAITVSASNAATSIGGSILVPITDGRFSISGGVLTVAGATFPNNDVYSAVSKMVGYTDATNTVPVYAGNGTEVEFFHTGNQLELLLQASGDGTNLPDWLMVDGQLVPATFISPEPGTNRKYRVLVQFASVRKRLIRLATGVRIGGVQVASGSEITSTSFARPWVSLLGDSWTSGTGADLNSAAWPFVTARALGYMIMNCGVGSTGIVQEKAANWVGTGQPLVNYADPYRLAQFANAAMAMGIVMGSQNDSNVAPAIWGPYGSSLDDAYNANLHKIADAWVAAKPGRPLIFVSGTSPSSSGQSYQYFRNRDIMHQVALSRRKDNVFFIDNNRPLTPWPGTGRTGAPATDGNGDLASLYVGGTTGSDTAHPAPAGHSNRGLSNAQSIKQVVLTEIAT